MEKRTHFDISECFGAKGNNYNNLRKEFKGQIPDTRCQIPDTGKKLLTLLSPFGFLLINDRSTNIYLL
jgi:hypothetical protein